MIRYLATYIKGRIEIKILRTLIRNPLASLESEIITHIIYPYLLTDLNLVGGVQKKLTVTRDMVFKHTENEIILLIPERFRNGTNIKSVDSLINNGDYRKGTNEAEYLPRDVLASPRKLLNDSNSSTNLSFETELTVIGNKYVSIRQDGIQLDSLDDSVLTFYVEYPANMNGIDRNYWPSFGEIALLAAKMHLYNNLDLEINSAFQQNSEIQDRLKMKIDSYEGAAMEYTESMDKLGKFSHLNNKEQMGDDITLMT
jgi:hypothetical protein